MEYVALLRHSPEVCPTSNSKVREQVQTLPPKLEQVGHKHQVSLKSSHILGPTHLMVLVCDAPSVEAVREFLDETGLTQWNNTELYPSLSIQEAMQALPSFPPPIW